MRVTNKYDLPQSLVKAASRSHRPREGFISPSAIISPPLVRKLTEQHYDEIEYDVTESIMSIIGTGFHRIMQDYPVNNTINEMPVSILMKGMTINGVIDNYNPVEGIIRDYKTTSLWSFMGNKPKIEWVKQLNVYAFMCLVIGLKAEKLYIEALCRDWVKNKSFQHGYPKIPYARFEIPLWEESEIADMISAWIDRYDASAPCTPEDRWAKDKSYAVIYSGRKTAVRVMDTREEAETWAKEKAKSKYSIVEREGKDTRCMNFCNVNKWCPYYQEKYNDEL